MADVQIPRDGRVQLGRVEGNLHAEPKVEIGPDPSGRMIILGEAQFEGDAVITGPFECQRLRIEDGSVVVRGDLTVNGDTRGNDSELEVFGRFSGHAVDVDRSLHLHGDGVATDVDIGGFFQAEGAFRAETISAGGRVRIAGALTADEIAVGGTLNLSDVDLKRLKVGGSAEVGSGKISESISVGGRFASVGDLTFGSMEVGGIVHIGGTAQGRSIEVGGKFTADKDLRFESLEIGGLGDIKGNGTGGSVEIGGRFNVGGSLSLSGELEVGGEIEVGGEVRADKLESGGKFSARRAIIQADAEILGRLTTQEGLRAARISLGRKAVARGPLVGNEVELERSGRADEVFGHRIHLRRDCEVRLVVGDSVEIEDDCSVDEVRYVMDLKLGRNVRTRSAPQKIATLPAFPL